jgi:hypothetical protein
MKPCLLLFVFALAITGCGSVSKVLRAGKDTYIVSAGGGMYEQNPSSIREEVYEKANAHCDRMGRSMEPIATDERPYRLGRHTASIALTFTCK